MKTDCAAIPFLQRRKIAERLGLLEHAERVWLVGDLHLRRVFVRQLYEDAVRRSALVQLSGRVKEARAVAGRRCDAQLIAQRGANLPQDVVVLVSLLNVSEQRDVITGFDSRKVRGDDGWEGRRF